MTKMAGIKTIKPGLLTTVQDQGRWGYQQYGVAVAGAMDQDAMAMANLLVQNDPDEAVLEMTLIGGTFETDTPIRAALAGADMGAKLDGRPLAPYRSFSWRPGQVLSLGPAREGTRTYLALAGGLGLDPVLGSRSTYLRGKMGGLEGRKLKAGDILPLRRPDQEAPLLRLADSEVPRVLKKARIRLVMGPQAGAFTEEGVKTFLSETYTLTKDIDRMGYRLRGKAIESVAGSDIISDGIVFGSVQVTGDGQPTIMMADHQTTGGYAKIATIIRPDLPILAQMGEGDRVSFEAISPDEALEIYRAWREDLDRVKDRLVPLEEDEDFLDLDAIEDLLDHFEESGISGLNLDLGAFHIELERGGRTQVTRPQAPGHDPAQEADREEAGTLTVEAPITGTCYRAPDPDEPPFVEVGDRVSEGDPLLIVEVMKMMNEVEAPQAGKVVEILFENEEAVQAGSPLIRLEVD